MCMLIRILTMMVALVIENIYLYRQNEHHLLNKTTLYIEYTHISI